MLIASMSGHKQGMTFLIMQDDQSATSQDFSCAPDQPAWDQRIGIDGLAVPIDVKDGNRVYLSRVVVASTEKRSSVPELL